MKRRLLITIAVFLFAGGVVNVTVAWGCWSGSDANLQRRLPGWKILSAAEALDIAEDLGFTPVISPDGIQIVYANGSTIDCGFGTTLDMLGITQVWTVERAYAEAVADSELADFSHANIRRVHAGWPTHTLRGYEITVEDNETGELSSKYRWALSARQDKPPFPLLPTWPGVAVNTPLYGVVLWLLIRGPFVPRRVVRAIRVKRGGCTACGYPAGRSDVCSECGKPLPDRTAVTRQSR